MSLPNVICSFLWSVTQSVLLRYDGSRIRRFEQVEKTTSHYTDRLLIAPDGALWVKGGNGIGRLKQERFAPLPLPEKAGLLAESPQGFAVDSANNVFVAVEHGLVRVEARHPFKARLFAAEDGLPVTV